MPICPACKEESGRRTDGACPKCGTPVMLHDGHWFLEGPDSPVEKILMHFEDHKTTALRRKKGSGAMRFVIPRNHPLFKKEMEIASKYLAAADYDLDLVLKSLDVLFEDPDYAWRTWGDSLSTMWDSFITAMSIARGILEQEEEKVQRQREAYEKLQQREDLF